MYLYHKCYPSCTLAYAKTTGICGSLQYPKSTVINVSSTRYVASLNLAFASAMIVTSCTIPAVSSILLFCCVLYRCRYWIQTGLCWTKNTDLKLNLLERSRGSLKWMDNYTTDTHAIERHITYCSSLPLMEARSPPTARQNSWDSSQVFFCSPLEKG